MNTEDKYGLYDLINFSVEHKPIEFEDAFNDVIWDRLDKAVNDMKIEIAQSLFNSQRKTEEE